MTSVVTEVKNTVHSIAKPPAVVLLSEGPIDGWCEQYSQEGFDVYHILFSNCEKGLDELPKIVPDETEFAIVTYGLPETQSSRWCAAVQKLLDLGLRICVHYCPTVSDGTQLLLTDNVGKYLPTLFHVPSSQEVLQASLLPLTDPGSFPYKLKGKESPPIQLHVYPRVPTQTAFPLLTQAPAAVAPGNTTAVDPYILSATNLSYSRTLSVLKREIGPHFDLEKIWGEHIYYEFEVRDALKTMATMVRTPYVNHVPTMTGGVGFDDLSRFYKYHFTSKSVTPPDTEIITISRTVGSDRIIDEMIFKCTHTTEIDYFLPGIKPTGKPLELALVGVIAFRGDKLCFEYWDQASALVQLGLLDESKYPVGGRDVSQKVLDPFGMPSNALLTRWKESEGKVVD